MKKDDLKSLVIQMYQNLLKHIYKQQNTDKEQTNQSLRDSINLFSNIVDGNLILNVDRKINDIQNHILKDIIKTKNIITQLFTHFETCKRDSNFVLFESGNNKLYPESPNGA